jgi:hypothetical protein
MLIKREMDEIWVGDTNDDCHVGGRTRVQFVSLVTLVHDGNG